MANVILLWSDILRRIILSKLKSFFKKKIASNDSRIIFMIIIIYTWIFENRVSKNINSFYYLAIKDDKSHSKAD